MMCNLKISGMHSDMAAKIEMKYENSDNMDLSVEFTDKEENTENKQKIENSSIDNSELVWRSNLLKVIRGM